MITAAGRTATPTLFFVRSRRCARRGTERGAQISDRYRVYSLGSRKVKRQGHPEKMLQHKVALAQSRHRMAQPLGAIKGFKIVADEDLRRRHDLLEQHTFVLERKEHTLHARLAGMDAMLQQQRLESSAAAINREDLHGTLNRELLEGHVHEIQAQAKAFTQQLQSSLERSAAEDAVVVGTLASSIAGVEEELKQLKDRANSREREAERKAATDRERERSSFLLAQVSMQEEHEATIRSMMRQHRGELEQVWMETSAVVAKHITQHDAERSLCVNELSETIRSLEDELGQQESRHKSREAELLRRLGVGSTRCDSLQAKVDQQKTDLVAKDRVIEQQQASFERELQRREQTHSQHYQGLQVEIETARSCHVEQHDQLCRDHQAQLYAHSRDMEAIHAQLKADHASHAKEARDLHDQLAAHSRALHTSRESIEGLRADVERASEAKRKDAALGAAIDRNQRMYYLETGLIAQRRSALQACYSMTG